MKRLRRLKAQSLSEYSLCLAILLLAIVAMNVYVKRGLQGRYADVMDATIRSVQASAGKSVPFQYEPYYVDSETNVNFPRSLTEQKRISGSITRALSPDSITVSSNNIEGANVDK